MARPIKNNADYFPHDSHMRNDPKVKAVRRKFGIEGYAIYCMLIEYLASSDHFKMYDTPQDRELIGGDFDCDPERVFEVLDYCISIDLFQSVGEVFDREITCETLEKVLYPLLSKRKLDRSVVSDIENPQSKVKESKGERNTGAQALASEVHLLLKRKSSNTSDTYYMVLQWLQAGHSDILPQLRAMRAYYDQEGLTFPTKIETLTQSFQDADWITKLKESDPEKIAERRDKAKVRTYEHDTIGTSAPGSLG